MTSILVGAAAVGILPRVAMGMTFRELRIYSRGQGDRDLELLRQATRTAWLTAGLMRSKKLPELAAILPKRDVTLTPKQRRQRFIDRMRMLARPGELTIGKPK